MKKFYEEPTIEIQSFDIEDVVTASSGEWGSPEGEDD